MPDLRYAAVQAWLREHAAVAAAGSATAGAPYHGDQLSSKVVELGDVLGGLLAGPGLPVSSGSEPSSASSLRLVLAYLHPAIRLRVLACLEASNDPGGAQHLKACFTADHDGHGDLNRLTVDEFGRLETIERIFAPSRLSRLAAACGQADLGALPG